MQKRLLRPDEVAESLSVSKWTVYRWVEEGKLKGTKLGAGVLRIFSDSVEDLIQERTIHVALRRPKNGDQGPGR
ncbi:MAG: helix-turn-helix transcriptional regulator [Nitrospiria bacterium]